MITRQDEHDECKKIYLYTNDLIPCNIVLQKMSSYIYIDRENNVAIDIFRIHMYVLI